jgi:hypothetical protein
MAASASVTLALAPSSDSGVVGDGITRIARPTLTGLAKAGAAITVRADGVVIGTAKASARGIWNFVPAVNLANGDHTITASELDADGSTIALATLPLTIDEVARPPTLLLAASSDSGVIGDDITNDRRPILTGNAEPGATVSIRIDGALVGTTKATSAGAWSFMPSVPLTEGKHTIDAAQLDVAGNNSLASTLALTIDTIAASPAVTLATGSDSGVVGDNITNVTRPTIIGAAEPGETVNILIDGVRVGSTQVSNGTWSFQAPTTLSNGSHSVTVSGIDVSGNVSVATTLIVTIDTSTPDPTVALSRTSTGGGIDDNIANTETPSFTGTAEAGDTVSLQIDGKVLGSVRANSAGAWTFQPGTALGNGLHTIAATATDAAGNAASGMLGFTVDAPPPPGSVVTSPTIPQPRAPRDIVGLVLQNPQSIGIVPREITFGQQFAPGQVRPSQGIVAVVNGVTIPVQMDVKTTNPDGSVATAILTMRQPAIGAGASLNVMLRSAPASGRANIDIAALTHGNFNVIVSLSDMKETLGSCSLAIPDQQVNVGSLLARALRAGQVTYWLKGPQVTEAEIETDVPGTPLRLTFDVAFYADGSTHTDIAFNDDIATVASLGNQVTSLKYDVSIMQNGSSVLRQQDITQWQYQTWDQQIWSNGAPEVNVQQNVAALERTGAILNYDLTQGITSGSITQEASSLGGSNFGILGSGGITQIMTWTGGRPDIGTQPEWVVDWLMTQSSTARADMLAQANAGGGIPWHMYNGNTDAYLTTTQNPRLWYGVSGMLQPAATKAQTGWVPDPSHQPDLDYIAYLTTGDLYYLDQLNAQASYDILAASPTARQQAAGLVANLKDPVRAEAWSLREVLEAAAANPDGSPMKAYFSRIATNNIQFLLSQLASLTAKEGQIYGWFGQTVSQSPGATAPWQQDMMATTMGQAASMGIPGAAQVLKWQTNFIAGRFTNMAEGLPPTDGEEYVTAVADPKTGIDYTTWAQVEADSRAAGYFTNAPGTLLNDGEYQSLAKAALAESFTWTGSTQALQAYGWLLANGTTAPYTSDDVVPRLSDGQLLTSNMVFILNDTGAASQTIDLTGSDQLVYEKGSAPVTIVGGSGVDLLFGGSGVTTLVAGSNKDYLFAGSGSTTLRAGNGTDFLQAGAGADVFDISGNIGTDLIAGLKLGTDRLHVSGASAGSSALAHLIATATTDPSGNAALHLAPEHSVTLLGIGVSQVRASLFV